MRAHTGLCFVAVALSGFAMVFAAVNRDWHWCAAYGILDIIGMLMLRRSLKMASMPPREDRREDDPKERIGS